MKFHKGLSLVTHGGGYDSAVVACITHTKLWRNSSLACFLGKDVKIDWPGWRRKRTPRIGWGRKPSGLSAAEIGSRFGAGYLLLEDGFVRSLGLASDGHPSRSLVVDASGIYYDANTPSDLEKIIQESHFDQATLERAKDCMVLLRRHRLSKYNHAPDKNIFSGDGRQRVLVVDQTFGDLSVRYGKADRATFEMMLNDAVVENPGKEILVKVHPDVLAGKKQGYLLDAALQHGCRLIAENVNPWSIIEAVERVYVVTSQLGFEALLAQKAVACYGLPFYAGWGLTQDKQICSRRRVKRSLEHVFASAYFQYARYLDPRTGQRCELEDAIAAICEERERLWCSDS